jgi:hypothetical protein
MRTASYAAPNGAFRFYLAVAIKILLLRSGSSLHSISGRETTMRFSTACLDAPL